MHTSLGYIGQCSSTPKEALWGGVKAPNFIHCKAALATDAYASLISENIPTTYKQNQGLARCRNLFCPYCHKARQQKLCHSLKTAFKAALNKGLHLYLLTLTIAHNSEQSLNRLIEAVVSHYAKARQGSPFTRLKQKQGLLGVINVLEVTYSPNGWNPHIHAVIFARTEQGAITSGKVLSERFKRFSQKNGFICNENTCDLRLVYAPEKLAEYLTKSWFNHSPPSLTPFGLARLAFKGDEKAKHLYQECFYALQNRKNGLLSPSLKKYIFKI